MFLLLLRSSTFLLRPHPGHRHPTIFQSQAHISKKTPSVDSHTITIQGDNKVITAMKIQYRITAVCTPPSAGLKYSSLHTASLLARPARSKRIISQCFPSYLRPAPSSVQTFNVQRQLEIASEDWPLAAHLHGGMEREPVLRSDLDWIFAAVKL